MEVAPPREAGSGGSFEPYEATIQNRINYFENLMAVACRLI